MGLKTPQATSSPSFMNPGDSASGTAAKLTPSAESGRQTFALTELMTGRFASRALLLRYLQPSPV
jgi:hypothetical protein